MKHKIISLICIIAICFSLCGCAAFANNIPDLSEADRMKVVEYAAESLLKFDNKHGDKVSSMPADHYIKEPEPSPEPVFSEELGLGEKTEENGNELNAPGYEDTETNVIDNTVDKIEDTGFATISEAVGLPEGVSVEYQDYEVTDIFPKSLDAFFSVNATKGNELFILSFSLKNNTEEDVYIDMPSNNVRFKIKVNDTQQNALTTLLVNDFSYYKNTIPAGETKEVVIVGEFSKEDISTINNIQITVKKDDITSYFTLR